MGTGNIKVAFFIFSVLFQIGCCAQNDSEKILGGYRFTEGPAVNKNGVIFFSDVPESKIYRFDPVTGESGLFLDNTGGANGLFFDQEENLIACAGKSRKLVKITPEKSFVILVDQYQGKALNSPNDLWIDPKGGIYFTDPRYGNKDNMEQDGMHVYYYIPEKDTVLKVIENLIRPNGIIGSEDGNKIYVVDEGARKTYVYARDADGKLKNQELFFEGGIDGMSRTAMGNICITDDHAVQIISPDKENLRKIGLNEQPTNVLYFNDLLYITTQQGNVLKTDVSGL